MSLAFSRIDARLAEVCTAHKIPGASLAIWDGGQVHTAQFGVRNIATGDAVTPDTLMHLGSITKMLNATLVLQLVDEGLVRLDDPVLKHLPSLQLADRAALAKLTVRMLLNHTSGIDGIMLPDHGPDAERIEDAVARFAGMGQLHEPGAGPSYCNPATVIAGHLVQTLRGKSWYALVKERIFQPLGLEHSMVDVTETPLHRVSVGHLPGDGTASPVVSPHPFLPLSFAPAGATGMMSATDLLSFGRAHLNGGVGLNGQRILSAESTALMQQPTAQAIEPHAWRWGLGWLLYPGGLIGHGGSGPGFKSNLYLHPASGRAAAVLMNGEDGFAAQTTLLDELLRDWTGTTPMGSGDTDTPSAVATAVDPSAYAGRYRNSVMAFDIGEEGGTLTIRTGVLQRAWDHMPTDGNPAIVLQPLQPHLFRLSRPVPGLPADVLRFMPPDAHGKSPGVAFFLHLLMRQKTA